MKKAFYRGMGLGLCLWTVLWAGCEKSKERHRSPSEVVADLEASMVYVAGGSFSMGATGEQGEDVWDNEKPVHTVTLDDFYMGKYEVTQAQWEAVMGMALADMMEANDWSSYGLGDDCPMYNVSWHDAFAFCERLNELTGKTYRLPTEAEWEYAARGGRYADGTRYAGSDEVGEVAWFEGNNWSLGANHPDYGINRVGQKKPNGLGLYDMSGSVWEWCQDWYGADFYTSPQGENPQGPDSGTLRVSRGGSWSSDARYCRVSFRDYGHPDIRGRNLGFRVVCDIGG